MTETTDTPSVGAVRARFCPSPTGIPHVGLVRAALFNWAFARHNGGQLVFRIEDTDAARDSEESYAAIIEGLRWLGIDWDEGPEVGGPYGPYRQSERGEIYADVARRLLEAGELYESFSSAADIEERRKAAGQDPKLGYDNADRELTEDRKAELRAEGREPVLRLRMPDEDITFTDLIRGEVTFAAGSVPDPVLIRANGAPLYPFVNPVDDAMMRITHILRGEDLLPSTPRQIALFAALRRIGVAESIPSYAHLPLVRGEGNKKLSKRDPESNLFNYRDRGFLPEGMLNYLALLGWSIAEDRDVFSMAEMVAAFDISRVSPNPARFDLKKAEAINATHLRALPAEEFVRRLLPYLVQARLLPAEPTGQQLELLRSAAALVQERVGVLAEGVGMLRFLFVADADFAPEPDSAAKAFGEGSGAVLAASERALTDLAEWTTPEIERALKEALVDGLELKPRKAFAPVRVAVTGRTVSPPLYESMELLGRDRTLARLRAAISG
ncbi:glutamyl-tRNA synthetase [Tamaricihabitans halophyticus]|uniref:Glutamate--tRNA ligase n=1 Tax=Tamaricihabitans halophyticus TaxID=1262583 RepID=A0A4R2QSG0_9PSEU|nr:glutamate--tRNA ligase [Tamaricihabitans halophyticus]TCP52064.1 glutamyl-tRNA synthetase [Tamaricihabitans halophyticus]